MKIDNLSLLATRFEAVKEYGIRVVYLETSGGISALSSVAYRVVQIALVDVFARFPCIVHLVTGVTYTPIISNSVFASAVGAHGWILSALINIWKQTTGVNEPQIAISSEVIFFERNILVLKLPESRIFETETKICSIEVLFF